MINKLKGQRCYLVGPMDRVSDGGETWRDKITPELKQIGIVVLNPANKPCDLGNEVENRKLRKQLKKERRFQEVVDLMVPIRSVDLRMLHNADFIIARLSKDEPACGTYEEIFLACNERKPVLLWMVEGLTEIPDWFWAVFRKNWREFFFHSQESLLNYLRKVDGGEKVSDRWIFFDEL